jgi:transcriptional regulator GlxA family with amidase domain
MVKSSKINGSRDDVSDQKIERCIAHMLSHLNKRVTVPELAQLANLSPTHFTALFKQKTGCPPINFFIRLRIHQACQLLKADNMSIREIARTLGYKDPFFFSRQFKSINGAAPKSYRRTGSNLIPPIPQTPLSTAIRHF